VTAVRGQGDICPADVERYFPWAAQAASSSAAADGYSLFLHERDNCAKVVPKASSTPWRSSRRSPRAPFSFD